MRDLSDNDRLLAERQLLTMSKSHPVISARQQIARFIYETATDSQVVDAVYDVWKSQSDSLMSEHDYINMAYHLALVRPSEWKQIISMQRSRVTGVDRLREFDFISRACSPDTIVQQQLFNDLLKQENRRVEPWARNVMSLLNAPTREPFSNRYIVPSLDELQKIQRTGDIFFPAYWLSCLLNGHKSDTAKAIVKNWIAFHPDYPQPLMNKIKENAFRLLTQP
jgi:aminopeptidase N